MAEGGFAVAEHGMTGWWNPDRHNRHCERSEAIHRAAKKARMDCFVASAPRNDADTASRSRGASRPKFCRSFRPPQFRGRRECRIRAAPAVSCATCTKNMHMSIQGSGEHPTFPAQWLYGLWRALPGEQLFCLRSALGNRTSPRSIDASNATSGPHAFAVRNTHLRQVRASRPPHPRPHVRDVRTPL